MNKNSVLHFSEFIQVNGRRGTWRSAPSVSTKDHETSLVDGILYLKIGQDSLSTQQSLAKAS